MDQFLSVHVTIFPPPMFRQQKVMCFYPPAVIPQTGRNPRLVYDFSWSGLNARVHQAASKEAAIFGRDLYILLYCII